MRATLEIPCRPIIMSPAMADAARRGLKTQTRRVIKPQPAHIGDDLYWSNGKYEVRAAQRCDFVPGLVSLCPYGKTGDQLWVREAWAVAPNFDEVRPSDLPSGLCVVYRADNGATAGRYRSSIHMPRWASRLTLEVLSVRAERLQDISQADARAEAATFQTGTAYWWTRQQLVSVGEIGISTLDQDCEVAYGKRGGFAHGWDRLNAKRGHPWASNPWVWVITFRVRV